MDLSHGSLYWPTTLNNIPSYPTLKENITCDVLIVGGGMSGALCSYQLSKEPIDIVLVDKRKIGHGSSSANTGLLQYSNDTMLHEFIPNIGEKKAVRFYQLCLQGMKELEEIAQSLSENVQFKKRKSLYYASTEDDVHKLKKEYQMLKKYNFQVDYLEKEEIKKHYGFEKPAALVTEGDAEINPLKFIIEVLREAHKKNVRIYEHTEVKEVDFENGYYKLESKQGSILAKKVIYSTGYESKSFIRKEKGELNRTFAIATSPVPSFEGWDGQNLIWETKRPYFYMRTTFDGRIIAGGLDEDPMEAPSNPEIIKKYGERLLKRIKEHYPDFDIRAEYVYGATFGESDDGIPFIGEHPEKKNIYYCLGYGGNGTVYSMFGSRILADLIMNRENKDKELVMLNR